MDIVSGKKTPPEAAGSDPSPTTTITTTRIHLSKLPVSFSNGVLKRNHHTAFNNNQIVAAAEVFVYKECLKNHAASLGSHAVDGCGEFMPSPTCNSADPTSLKCAACGCHRNFHRREPDDVLVNNNPASLSTPALEYQPHHRHHPLPPPPPPNGDGGSHSSPSSESPPPISSSYYPSAPHLLLTLSGGGGGGMSQDQITPAAPAGFQSNGRKRFRTRFTQNQKDKMLELAEKMGWRMQRRDDGLINGICNEIGVERGVFKVWMHNNKSSFGKNNNNQINPSTTTTTGNNNTYSGTTMNDGSLNNQQGNNTNDDSFSGGRVTGGGANGSSTSS